MNYQTHSKNRKIRHRVSRLMGSLSFNFLHLRGSHRLVLLGQALILVSLAFPWFAIGDDVQATPFSGFLGRTGFMLVFLALLLAVLVLSNRTKEGVKNKLGIQFSDHSAIVFFGITEAFLILAASSFMWSLPYFTKDVSYYDIPSVAFVGAFCVVGGGFLSYRESKREALSTLYIENSQTTDAQFAEYESLLAKTPPEKKNMSLPI